MKLLATFFVIFYSGVIFAQDYFDRKVLDSITKNEQLNRDMSLCPKDLFEGREIEYQDLVEECRSDQRWCLNKCLSKSANHCIGLGHVYVDMENNPQYSRRLYAQACKLGIVNSCTNYAAGMLRFDEGSNSRCYAETFRFTCSKSDEWGCMMYGMVLHKGIGIVRNDSKAILALKKSCQIDEENEACDYSKSLASKISTTNELRANDGQ
ncbi:hypothetical protein QT397_18990 [Microbulbifer sp. MKSA007]|nr:hypothetical protein QT397_18990 [Microbulbifer sp. MKSA007]